MLKKNAPVNFSITTAWAHPQSSIPAPVKPVVEPPIYAAISVTFKCWVDLSCIESRALQGDDIREKCAPISPSWAGRPGGRSGGRCGPLVRWRDRAARARVGFRRNGSTRMHSPFITCACLAFLTLLLWTFLYQCCINYTKMWCAQFFIQRYVHAQH